MRGIAILVSAILATVILTFSVVAHEVRSGNIVISHPVIPAPLKAQPVAAGYLHITNNGDRTERLVSVEAAFSGKAEIHTMKLVEGVMRMRPVAGGVDIAAGETVVLKQGGFHLMFGKLAERPEIGEFKSVTLNFARAGAIDVDMLVVERGDLDDEYQASGAHSGHSANGGQSGEEHSGHSNE